MEYLDKSFLLRQAYFWKFDGPYLLGQKARKWLQGIIDNANAEAIERSAAIVEEQMRNLFQNDIRLRALSDGFPIKPQSFVEFDHQELMDKFELDVNLFLDLHDWIIKTIGVPYLKSLPNQHRYWTDIQNLNTQVSVIAGWSYEKDGDERVRLIKKANFIIGWLNLLSRAGIEKDKISRKAFERWQIKKQGNAGMSA